MLLICSSSIVTGVSQIWQCSRCSDARDIALAYMTQRQLTQHPPLVLSGGKSGDLMDRHKVREKRSVIVEAAPAMASIRGRAFLSYPINRAI